MNISENINEAILTEHNEDKTTVNQSSLPNNTENQPKLSSLENSPKSCKHFDSCDNEPKIHVIKIPFTEYVNTPITKEFEHRILPTNLKSNHNTCSAHHKISDISFFVKLIGITIVTFILVIMLVYMTYRYRRISQQLYETSISHNEQLVMPEIRYLQPKIYYNIQISPEIIKKLINNDHDNKSLNHSELSDQ